MEISAVGAVPSTEPTPRIRRRNRKPASLWTRLKWTPFVWRVWIDIWWQIRFERLRWWFIRALPPWVRYFCTICVWADATSGKYGNTDPTSLKVAEALDRVFPPPGRNPHV